MKKSLYLSATIFGFVASLVQVIPMVWQYKLQYIPLFAEHMFASHGATFISIDILSTLILFWIFAWYESRKLGMKHYWVYIVGCFLIGLFFSFPLFLYMRERAIERQNKKALQ